MAENFVSMEEAENNLLSCATYLADDIKSAEGYSEAMKAIVPHYIERGDVDTAAGLADTVDDPFVRDRLLLAVAEKCAEIGDEDYAFQLAEAVEDHGMQEAAREAIAVQLAAKTEFEKALEIAAALSHNSHAYALIAAHFASQNHEHEALQTAEKIDFPLSKANALQNIALINFNKGNDETSLPICSKNRSRRRKRSNTTKKRFAHFTRSEISFPRSNATTKRYRFWTKRKRTRKISIMFTATLFCRILLTDF